MSAAWLAALRGMALGRPREPQARRLAAALGRHSSGEAGFSAGTCQGPAGRAEPRMAWPRRADLAPGQLGSHPSRTELSREPAQPSSAACYTLVGK